MAKKKTTRKAAAVKKSARKTTKKKKPAKKTATRKTSAAKKSPKKTTTKKKPTKTSAAKKKSAKKKSAKKTVARKKPTRKAAAKKKVAKKKVVRKKPAGRQAAATSQPSVVDAAATPGSLQSVEQQDGALDQATVTTPVEPTDVTAASTDGPAIDSTSGGQQPAAEKIVAATHVAGGTAAIFISHSSKDTEATNELLAKLEEQGHRSVFLDFDPEYGIPPGRNWEKELYTRLRGCRAVIVLCSEASMESDWCFAEITHARSLGKHIFPVKVAPCSLRSVLTDVQVIDLSAEGEKGYEKLEHGLLLAGLDPKSFFSWDGSRPPYPGLLAFQEADVAVFFGREAEIQRGLDLMQRLKQFGGARMAIALGASGSGKSSLVRAGLVPRLKRDEDRWLVIDPFRPQQQPVRELALVLSNAFKRYEAPRDWQEIRKLLDAAVNRPKPDGRELIELAEELGIAAGKREATVVLVIDQVEEFLGYASEDQASRFLPMLRAALELENSPLMVLGTLRSDFLGDFQNHPAMQELAFESLPVGPMSPDGFAQVIEGPAAVAGLDLEPGLVQAMVDDTRTQDALPLLAFTLREMYERHGADGKLEIAHYTELDGLEGSVALAAKSVMAAKPLSAEEQDDLRTAFVSMVRINEEGQYARKPARWGNLPQRSQALLERFVAARLLVSRSDDEGRIAEVAHEALFRRWELLKGWLDEDRNNIHLRDGIRKAAEEWDAGGREAQLLVHRGGRLESAEALARQPRFELNAVAREYVQDCVKLRQAAASRLKRWLMAVTTVAVIAILASVFAWRQWRVSLGEIGKNLAARLSLSTEQDVEEFDKIVGAIKQYKAHALPHLEAIKSDPPENRESVTWNAKSRIDYGKQRADAAIALFRLDEPTSALDLLRIEQGSDEVGIDPEPLTQFVHRCNAERGVEAAVLYQSLKSLMDKRMQGSQSELPNDPPIDDVMPCYTLLLALGNYEITDLGESPDDFRTRIDGWYRNDPSSAIHSACSWLMRRWDSGRLVEAADEQLATESVTAGFESHREWFVYRPTPTAATGDSTDSGKTACLTFVVFEPGQYPTVSNPNALGEYVESKSDAQTDSTSLNHMTISRGFAICDRELTKGQYQGVATEHPDKPAAWDSGAVQTAQDYCERLTMQNLIRGVTFRLPTEAEWECASRGGAVTPFCFGTDATLELEYGFVVNPNFANRGKATEDDLSDAALLRPNLRGLFDVHGNVYELCGPDGEKYPLRGGSPIRSVVYRYDDASSAVRPKGAQLGLRLCVEMDSSE